MPFIKIKTSTEITPEQEVKIKAGLGQAIRLVPGKSEQYLLLEFEDRCRMWLRGQKDDPIAYIEAAIFGNEDHEGFDAFTAAETFPGPDGNTSERPGSAYRNTAVVFSRSANPIPVRSAASGTGAIDLTGEILWQKKRIPRPSAQEKC